MKTICAISGVAGMTGSMVARQLLEKGIAVVGFDNFFCGSRKVVGELESLDGFKFFEYDIRVKEQMSALFAYVRTKYGESEKWFLNCADVVHTKHF